MKLKTNASINRLVQELACTFSIILISSLSCAQSIGAAQEVETIQKDALVIIGPTLFTASLTNGSIGRPDNDISLSGLPPGIDSMPLIVAEPDLRLVSGSGTNLWLSGTNSILPLISNPNTIPISNGIIRRDNKIQLADYQDNNKIETTLNPSSSLNPIKSEILPSSNFSITNNQIIDANTSFTVADLTYEPHSTLLISDESEVIVSGNYTSADEATVSVTHNFDNNNYLVPIIISNEAKLRGTLRVNFLNAPDVNTLYGNTVTIIRASSIEGDFSCIESTLAGAHLVGSVQTNSATGEESYIVTVEPIRH
jgi:hypothetical protein